MKRLLFFGLLLSCLFFCGSVSLAFTTAELQADCRDKLQILTDKGLLDISNVNNVNLNFFGDWGTPNGYVIIVGHGNNNNYGILMDTTTRLYIFVTYNTNNIVDYTNNTGSSSYNEWKQGSSSLSGGRNYTLQGTTIANGSFKYNQLVEPFYCYNGTLFNINTRVLRLGPGEEYGGSYLLNNFNFEFATNYHVNLNGVDCLAYILPYSFQTWNLGQCQNWEELDELVFYLRDENDIVLYSTTYTAQEYFNHPMHIYDNGFLYIVSRLVDYRTRYKLEWEAYQGGSMVSNYVEDICFLPPKNTVVDSNGNVTQIGSGDYTTQDSTNDIIDTITSSGDPELILSNDLFSGDSGDIYARFGYKDYNNPYKDFILRVFYGIMNTLTSSGNVNLILPVRDKAIILKSDDFVISSITFRILLSGMLVFFILYKLYAKFKILLDELAEGNINYTLNFKDGKFTEYWFF